MNFKYFRAGTVVPFIAILAIISNIIYLNIDSTLIHYPILKLVSSYLPLLSVLGIMFLILNWMNMHLWKYSLTNLIIKIPNLNGRYEGSMISSYLDDNGNRIKMVCVMEIIQNASKVHIHTYIGRGENESSTSETICEELVLETNNIYTLYYNYKNVSDLQVELNDHKGTAYLSYFPDKKCLKGNYFNERKNNGEIKVFFKSNNLIGRFNEKL
jgi:hypothetical protein